MSKMNIADVLCNCCVTMHQDYIWRRIYRIVPDDGFYNFYILKDNGDWKFDQSRSEDWTIDHINSADELYIEVGVNND